MSYKKWEIDSDRIKKPTIRNFILQYLAQDFAKPKRFSEIWNFVRDRKICTKITLCVYLEGLEKDGIIQRIEKGKKHVEYVLSDRNFWKNFQKKYDKKMKADVQYIQKKINELIKKIEKGELTEEIVKGHILYQLTAFEDRQLEGITNLLMSPPITIFVAPSLIEDFIVIPYNLKVQLIWACYEKYPKVTMEAIKLLRKYKKEILNLEGYVGKTTLG